MDATVNRDPEQYQATDAAEDLDLLEHLIDRLATGDFAKESRIPVTEFFGIPTKPRRKA